MRRPPASRAVLSPPERAGSRRLQSGDRAGGHCEIRRWRRHTDPSSYTSDPRQDISPSLSLDRARTRPVIEPRELLSRPCSVFWRLPCWFLLRRSQEVHFGIILSNWGKRSWVKATSRARALASLSFIGVTKRTRAPSVRFREIASATIQNFPAYSLATTLPLP